MNGKKQILILEDDPRIATALSVRLGAAGYHVLTAGDGVRGLQLALQHQPDLIVMDIWMPVGLGFSVAQRLQSLGLSHIPIVIMTASKLDGLRAAAEDLGAVAFFEKPYDSGELLKTIARALNPDCSKQKAAANPNETQDSVKKTVLVVEDDARIAAALKVRLEAAGYRVVTAADGREALVFVMTRKPDLIITDIWMPRPIGFLNEQRLNQFGLAGVPVIYMTASKKKDLRRIAEEEGAFAFFEKPYDSKQLMAAVAEALAPRLDARSADDPSEHNESFRQAGSICSARKVPEQINV